MLELHIALSQFAHRVALRRLEWPAQVDDDLYVLEMLSNDAWRNQHTYAFATGRCVDWDPEAITNSGVCAVSRSER